MLQVNFIISGWCLDDGRHHERLAEHSCGVVWRTAESEVRQSVQSFLRHLLAEASSVYFVKQAWHASRQTKNWVLQVDSSTSSFTVHMRCRNPQGQRPTLRVSFLGFAFTSTGRIVTSTTNDMVTKEIDSPAAGNWRITGDQLSGHCHLIVKGVTPVKYSYFWLPSSSGEPKARPMKGKKRPDCIFPSTFPRFLLPLFLLYCCFLSFGFINCLASRLSVDSQ